MACCDCRKEVVLSLNDLPGKTVARVIPTALDTLEKSSVMTDGVLLRANRYAVQWTPTGKTVRRYCYVCTMLTQGKQGEGNETAIIYRVPVSG